MTLRPQRVRDDRLFPETRWAALIVFFILLPATGILWVAPDRTGDLWAWMIQPELTPIFLGSGYGAGAYFFWQTYRAERWHPLVASAIFAMTKTSPAAPIARRAQLTPSSSSFHAHAARPV